MEAFTLDTSGSTLESAPHCPRCDARCALCCDVWFCDACDWDQDTPPTVWGLKEFASEATAFQSMASAEAVIPMLPRANVVGMPLTYRPERADGAWRLASHDGVGFSGYVLATYLSDDGKVMLREGV